VYPQVVDKVGEVPVVTRRRLQEANVSIEALPSLNGLDQEPTPRSSSDNKSRLFSRRPSQRSNKKTKGGMVQDSRHVKEADGSGKKLRVKVKARRGRSFQAAAHRRANNNTSASLSQVDPDVIPGRRRLGMSGAAVKHIA